MYLLLTDVLTCPRCGPEFGLILLADRIEKRRVLEGRLGCANCRNQYPVRGGELDVRLSAPGMASDRSASAETVVPSYGQKTAGGSSSAETTVAGDQKTSAGGSPSTENAVLAPDQKTNSDGSSSAENAVVAGDPKTNVDGSPSAEDAVVAGDQKTNADGSPSAENAIVAGDQQTSAGGSPSAENAALAPDQKTSVGGSPSAENVVVAGDQKTSVGGSPSAENAIVAGDQQTSAGGSPAAEAVVADEQEAAVRIAALLGLAGAQGTVLIAGPGARLASAVHALVGEVEVVGFSATPAGGREEPGMTRMVGEGALPFRGRALRGVALTGGAGPALLAEAVRVVQPGGRILVENAAPGTARTLSGLGAQLLLDEEGTVVARPLGEPVRLTMNAVR